MAQLGGTDDLPDRLTRAIQRTLPGLHPGRRIVALYQARRSQPLCPGPKVSCCSDRGGETALCLPPSTTDRANNDPSVG